MQVHEVFHLCSVFGSVKTSDMFRKVNWLVVMFLCYANAILSGLSDEPSQAHLESEFSRPVPISDLTDLGNDSPENAARTLFWYLNEARKGIDDVTLIKSARGIILYHTGEAAKALIEIPGFTARLYPLLIESPDQISGVQFAPPHTYPRTSDVGVRVRINYRSGLSQIKTIAFRREMPGRSRWMARVSLSKDARDLQASFAPPMRIQETNDRSRG